MQFTEDVIADPDAPEIVVSGTKSVTRLSKGQVLVTYFVERDGVKFERLRVVWDYETYLATQSNYDAAWTELRTDEWATTLPKEKLRSAH